MPSDPQPPAQAVRLAHDVRGSGAPLVLVCGTGYPGATWPPDLVEPLARRYTVITYDHRGTGASAGTGDRYSTRLFATDLAGLLDELGLASAHVLGHSMGGRVAQWLALDAPTRVRSLILAASGPGQYDASHPQTAGIPVAAAVRLVEDGYEAYIGGLIRRTFFTETYAEAHPERVAWLVEAFWQHRPGLEDYLKHVAARQEHRTTGRLGEIGQPTLVMIGEEDTHVGGTGSHWDQSHYLAEQLPRAELRVIAGAKHGFFWSHPEDSVAAITDWIDRCEATA